MNIMSRYALAALNGVALPANKLNFVIEYSKDWNARRAAKASGYEPDSGYRLAQEDDIQAAIAAILSHRLDSSHIDAEWVLMEAVDNHRIARQADNISASNTALNLIAKHTMVDALASDKLNMNVQGDQAVMERLMRGRVRASKQDEPEDDDDQQVSFL